MNELFAALAKAQASMLVADNTSANPHFKHKYADLTQLVKASRPALTENGLSVIQRVVYIEGVAYLESILCHSSGQSISSSIAITPQKNEIQSMGSYLSYLRRYSYSALVGVVTQDEEDDDGEVAMGRLPEKAGEKQPYEKISKDQLDQLEYELQGHADIAEEFISKMNLAKLTDLPKYLFIKSIERIRTHKAAKIKIPINI
jgi:hypothetical protein